MVPGSYTPGSYNRHRALQDCQLEAAVCYFPAGRNNRETDAHVEIIEASPLNYESWRGEMMRGGAQEWPCNKFYLQPRGFW